MAESMQLRGFGSVHDIPSNIAKIDDLVTLVRGHPRCERGHTTNHKLIYSRRQALPSNEFMRSFCTIPIMQVGKG
jgi:hypothetical protein